jgi:hypothetical protein
VDQPAIVRPRVELIGTHLRVEGSVELGRFTRVSDYVNILSGFFNLQDVVLLSRLGEPTRINFPEFRVRLDEIAFVGQHNPEADAVGSGPWGDTAARTPASGAAPAAAHDPVSALRSSLFEGHGEHPLGDDDVSSTVFMHRPEREDPGAGAPVDKERRRLVISTDAHIIYGSAHLHHEASMMAFLDATDPHFIPLTNVRVRWLADRRLAGRFAFALVQRDHIVGVATDVSSGPSPLRGRTEPAAPDPWGFERGGREPQ